MRDPCLARLENTLLSSWSREDWRNWLFVPDQEWPRRKRWRLTVRYLRNRFRVWTLLPGDRFYWPDRDLLAEVTAVKGGQVQVALCSGFLWKQHGPLDLSSLGDRVWCLKIELQGTHPWTERI